MEGTILGPRTAQEETNENDDVTDDVNTYSYELRVTIIMQQSI